MRRILAFLTLLLLVAPGCATMTVSDFKGAKPQLALEKYFAGHTLAWGIFQDRFGNLKRQFKVDIHGTWDETAQRLTLVEDFRYSDGKTDQRIWKIAKLGPHTYEGRAADVEGVALGHTAGNALNWNYDLHLKVGSGTWLVHFNDWMWQQDGEVLINRAEVSKLGVEIGSLSIFFRKAPG